MSRRLLPFLAVLAAATVAGCGSGSTGESAPSCQDDRAALARVATVNDLDDATRAIQRVIAVERRAVARLREEGKSNSPTSTQLVLAGRAATRSLQEINGDAQGAMDPVRTGVPAARRAVAIADGLLQPLCASS
jgi:hypothetical protein